MTDHDDGAGVPPAPPTTRDTPPSGRHTAPRTTRDAVHHSAPHTTRDAPPDAAPHTTHDAPRYAAPPTTHDPAPQYAAPHTTRDGAPGTVLDQVPPSLPRQPKQFHRVNLPPSLAERFDIVRDLGSGGEADLLLVRDRNTDDRVVVRIYRSENLALDPGKLDVLRRADRRHLIGLLEWGQGDGCTWEILEYAAGGSLADLRKARPGPWPASAVWEVLTELLPAVEHAHSLRMVHRDIKPANILVKGTAPLDLVLADFGLATFLAATREMRHTTSRTSAYAAPEAATGDTSWSLDWWSLGIVLVELFTGRHPFQRLDGSWMDDVFIVRELTVHDIDLSGVADDRWRQLFRGLLTRAPEDRWGSAQVRRWCAGDMPEVAKPKGPAFVFVDAAYTDPRELAAAMRGHWHDARRLLAGQSVGSPQFLAFRDWAVESDLTQVLRVLSTPGRPERTLTQVIIALDPDGPPTFCQAPMDRAGLARTLGDAISGTAAAGNVVSVMYDDGILTVLDSRPGCDGYALLDARWHRLVEAFDQRIQQLGLAAPNRATHLAMLLLAAFPGQEQALGQQATTAAANRQALAQPWFRALAHENVPPDLAPALHAAIVLASPVAVDQTNRDIAMREQAAAEAARRAAVQREQSADNVWFIVGIICGAISCFPPLGLFTGPVAIYGGFRARRSGNRTGSNWCYGLGVVGLMVALCYIGSLASGA